MLYYRVASVNAQNKTNDFTGFNQMFVANLGEYSCTCVMEFCV